MPNVIVSNGVFRFHLVSAAMEAARRGTLEQFVTGAYPKGWLAGSLIRRLGIRSPRLSRFLDRSCEDLEEGKISSIWSAELLIQAGVLLGRVFGLHEVNAHLQGAGLRIYGWLACRSVNRSRADIYHFRAGYGGRSVLVAKSKGMLCLCDHSVVSPLVFDYMVEHGGKIPSSTIIDATTLSPMWKRVLGDLELADHLLVNSELVRTTLSCHQIPPGKVSVIYQGIDEKFLKGIPPSLNARRQGHILFAGEVSRRKGFDVLIQALEEIPSREWVFIVAGNVEDKAPGDYEAFLRRDNVRHVGFVSREVLAGLMVASPIFLFPSLAEGSARVVFEALACGCYVITTPNSGSVVEDGVHGAVVEPGDPHTLRRAIVTALEQPSRVREIGARNQGCVRTRYGQTSYGDQLDALYGSLLGHNTVTSLDRADAVNGLASSASARDLVESRLFSTVESSELNGKEKG